MSGFMPRLSQAASNRFCLSFVETAPHVECTCGMSWRKWWRMWCLMSWSAVPLRNLSSPLGHRVSLSRHREDLFHRPMPRPHYPNRDHFAAPQQMTLWLTYGERRATSALKLTGTNRHNPYISPNACVAPAPQRRDEVANKPFLGRAGDEVS